MVKVKSKKPVQPRSIICHNCKYELEFTGEDIKKGSSTDYTGWTDTYHYITCPRPSCNEEIIVSKY